ncbi:two-component system sensor histidine kinase NtrB [Spirochaeta dissipatitropha]
MRRFVQRALKILPKLTSEQIHDLVNMLARENEKLELVLDSMNEGVLVADTENRVIFINKPAERLVASVLNDAASELPVWEVFRDRHIGAFVQQTLLDQDTVQNQEFTVDDSGTLRTLDCSVVPLVQKGKIEGSIIAVEDISDRKRREARLRRFESLASLTTLAAGVAHEIKNPLGSIGIHMQLIEKSVREIGADKDKPLLQYVSVVNEEVERLNKIVVDFLFAVRPMDIQPGLSNLGVVVHEMLQFVRYELQQNRIELIEDIPDEIPELQIDERYIKQAVLNIVKNAIAAMPNGGSLRVSVEHSSDEVLLNITDNGVGMSHEVQNRIFEPYFTTRDFGSGLGLTLVYKIVREHNAEISVRSEPGEGSCFTILFPVPQDSPRLLSWKGENE